MYQGVGVFIGLADRLVNAVKVIGCCSSLCMSVSFTF